MQLLPGKQISFIIVIMLMTSLLFSCRGEPDATFVDFSKRVAVERPGKRSSERMQLRVAVAAIISAKETVVHYHQLLNYIAGKLGRKIQLIQRKTYGEINELIRMGQIDLAFICSGPYATGKATFGFQALAIPQVRGMHNYKSYFHIQNSYHQKIRAVRQSTGSCFGTPFQANERTHPAVAF